MPLESKTAPGTIASASERCPACRTESAVATARCPQCKLTLRSLDPKFGAVPRHSRYLTDRDEKLSGNEGEQLRKRLRLFHQKFPQSLLSVFVRDLPPGTAVSEYAFWLANRARFGSDEGKLEENFNVLLLVDSANRAAALSIGYGLEPYVTEEELQSVLAAATDSLRDGSFAEGIRAVIDAMTERLRENVKRVERANLGKAR